MLPWPACATSAAAVEEPVAMALLAIAAVAVESALAAGVAELVMAVGFAIAAATGGGV